MRRPRGAWLAALFPLVLTACSSGAASAPSPSVDGSKPVAHVGRQDIPESLFLLRMHSVSAAIDLAGGAQATADAMQRQLAARVVQSLIIDSVIAQEATAHGVAASDSDVQQQVDSYVQSAGGQSQLQTQLAQVGGSLDQLRDEIRSSLNEQRVEDIFAKQRAQDLLATLQSGGDFASLAKQNSEDASSAPQGGAVTGMALSTLQSQSRPLADALSALQPGQLMTQPVRDDDGYDIVRLDSRTGATVDYHRLLVAAPRPYLVKDRPNWFSAAIAQAVQQYCQLGEVAVYLSGLPQPCISPSASASASATSTHT